MEFPDRDAVKLWIYQTQLARRNLSAERASYFRGKHYELEKKKQGAPEGNTNRSNIQSGHSAPFEKTSERLGKIYGVDPATIKRGHK
jgi:hypothetical protein